MDGEEGVYGSLHEYGTKWHAKLLKIMKYRRRLFLSKQAFFLALRSGPSENAKDKCNIIYTLNMQNMANITEN